MVDIPTEAVAEVRGLDELRLLIFPQPLGRALKNQNTAPTTPPCFGRRPRSSSLLFESHWDTPPNKKIRRCKASADFWWGAQWDSNPRSPDPQSGALTDYAMGTISMRPKGLEPPAHCLEGSCSIHLSYGRTLLSHWVLIWFAAVSRSTLREV